MSRRSAGSPDADVDSAGLLRQLLLVLGALGVVGTAIELAMLRHGKSTEQLIPWAALGVMAVAVGLVAVRPTRSKLRAARAIGLASAAASALGIWEHVQGNYNAGPLDRVYGPRWDSMSALSRWWAASIHSVGPSPPLAPAILLQVALCITFATVAHPALRRRDRPAGAQSEPLRYEAESRR